MGMLRVMSRRGDDRVTWDLQKAEVSDPEAIAAIREAERIFNEERARWEKSRDLEYHVTVDRATPGWKGHVGVITTLIPDLALDVANTVAAICGPPVMYKFAILALRSRGLRDEQIYVSLERRMKCGVGKCGHCQINNVYVCQEGPVFNYGKIKDLKEAIQ